jgi:hypothetical protein
VCQIATADKLPGVLPVKYIQFLFIKTSGGKALPMRFDAN